MKKVDKIDLVYTWVDGNDPDWQEKKDKFNTDTIRPQAKSSCRFVSNDELKYSLRSVEKYAPWINHIYIITDNQVPKWLNTNNPKITIIDHTEIFPKDALPCFNSNAIEHCIINIPNLSEKFLYANDDMMFFAPILPDFFFKNNKPIYRVTSKLTEQHKTVHQLGIKNASSLVLNKYHILYDRFPDHNIDPYRKQLIKDCYNEYKEFIDETIFNRFRTGGDIPRFIYHFHACATKNGIYRKVHKISRSLPLIEQVYRYLTKKFSKDSLYIKMHEMNKLDMLLKKYNPKLLCINDSYYSSDNDRIEYRTVAEKLFFEKSSYEV